MTKKLLRRLAPTTAVVCLLVSCGPQPAEEINSTVDEASLRKAMTHALLLVDDSASMSLFGTYTNCPYFERVTGLPPLLYSRLDVVRAGLFGCERRSDGFLRRYRAKNLSIARINGTVPEVAFGSSRGALLNGALGLVPNGATPLTGALRNSAAYLGSFFTDANVSPSAPFVVVVIADGQSNGPSATFDFACDGSTVLVDGTNPTPGANYIATRDTICALAGNQEVHVHTIAIANTAPAFLEQMKEMASAGRGSFSTVSHPVELSDQLLKIMLNP